LLIVILIFLQLGDEGAVVLFPLSVIALVAFLACGTVFGVACGLLEGDDSFGGVFAEFAYNVTAIQIGRAFAKDGSSDLKSVKESAGRVAVDVPFAEFAQHLVYGDEDARRVFSRGQPNRPGFRDAVGCGAARERVVIAEGFAPKGGCFALVSTGQDVSTFVVHFS